MEVISHYSWGDYLADFARGLLMFGLFYLLAGFFRLFRGTWIYYLFRNGIIHSKSGIHRPVAWSDVREMKFVYGRGQFKKALLIYRLHLFDGGLLKVAVTNGGRHEFDRSTDETTREYNRFPSSSCVTDSTRRIW